MIRNDMLEHEAERRGVYGVDEVVFHGVRPVGVKKVYSDTLMIFLMKAAMPEKYKDRQQTEHTGPIGVYRLEEDDSL